MENVKVSNTDYGLLYLSNFQEGLSYYNWDRGVVYALKSTIPPNEFIFDFKQRNLVRSEVKNNTKYYVLTDTGLAYSKNLKSEVCDIFSPVLEIIEALKTEGFAIEEIKSTPPIISFYYQGRKYKILLEKGESEKYLRIILPTELSDLAVNDFKISLEKDRWTLHLKELLEANFKMYDNLNHTV